MSAKKKPFACPCGSGIDYRACCRPFHQGGEPADPAALVRSRFSAFALGEAAYLWRTLHPDHPFRARPEPDVLRELGRARRELRYRALSVHDVELEDRRARVLFTARVFEKGRDRSFVELSRFERTDEGWRYLDGALRPAAALAGMDLTVAAMDARLGRSLP
jgi:SEC-C motif-containing protein